MSGNPKLRIDLRTSGALVRSSAEVEVDGVQKRGDVGPDNPAQFGLGDRRARRHASRARELFLPAPECRPAPQRHVRDARRETRASAAAPSDRFVDLPSPATFRLGRVQRCLMPRHTASARLASGCSRHLHSGLARPPHEKRRKSGRFVHLDVKSNRGAGAGRSVRVLHRISNLYLGEVKGKAFARNTAAIATRVCTELTKTSVNLYFKYSTGLSPPALRTVMSASPTVFP